MLFQDQIKGYTHWGYCDMDVIWGKLDHFITDELLEQYDRLFIHGHLSIFKNTSLVNDYYKSDYSGVPYQVAVGSKAHFGFDESKGINAIYNQNRYPIWEQGVYADLKVDKYSVYINAHDNYDHQGLVYKDGQIIRILNNVFLDEWMYVHLQKRRIMVMPEVLYACDFVLYDTCLQPYGSSPPTRRLFRSIWYSLRQKLNIWYLKIKWNVHWFQYKERYKYLLIERR
jgi:hypothetical protein